jgi:hypothetical protein
MPQVPIPTKIIGEDGKSELRTPKGELKVLLSSVLCLLFMLVNGLNWRY